MTSSNTSTQSRAESLSLFYNAPDDALFNQIVVAHLLECSTNKLEKDRWLGGGVRFIKIGRAVRYRKSDVLNWLSQFHSQSASIAKQS